MLRPENQRGGYEQLFRRFNMSDLYPENEDRFHPSYEKILESLVVGRSAADSAELEQ